MIDDEQWSEWVMNTFSIYDITARDWQPNVGEESRKTWEDKFFNYFWGTYCNGKGLDIGFAGYLPNVKPILPTAIGVDLNYEGYDGKIFPFESESQDYVYSSHFLEHVDDRLGAIREQFRVTKKGGHIIIVVPHRDLYEKKLEKPSRFNEDHRIFYTPAILLKEIEDALEINSYRIRHLQDNDFGHDYSQAPEEHSKGQYEIEIVLQKL